MQHRSLFYIYVYKARMVFVGDFLFHMHTDCVPVLSSVNMQARSFKSGFPFEFA